MTHILSLIDSSIYGPSVCDLSSWVAKRLDASVELAHVIDKSEMHEQLTDLSGSIGLGARSALLAKLSDLDAERAQLANKHGRVILDEAKERLEKSGIENVTMNLRHGTLLDVMDDLGKKANIIILGKRGEGADFIKLRLGSNVEDVVRGNSNPTLLASRQFKPINNFLVSYDGSAAIERAIDYLCQNPLLQGLNCHLIMAGSENDKDFDKLNAAAVKLVAAGLDVKADIITGSAGQVIKSRVEKDNIDLLIMGAYSHSRLKQFFVGSTTTELIRGCLIPVMLFS